MFIVYLHCGIYHKQEWLSRYFCRDNVKYFVDFFLDNLTKKVREEVLDFEIPSSESINNWLLFLNKLLFMRAKKS